MRSLSTRAAGFAILVLGVWGGLIPFVGPYLHHYSLGPNKAWTWTTGRWWLDVLPAIAAVVGGLMLISAGWRPHARAGALLALLAGIWFVVGPDLSHLWNAAGAQGIGHGSARLRGLESLGYHTGLGVLIAALAAYVLPRFPAVARAAAGEEAVVADRGAAPGRRHHVARDAALAGGAVAAGAAAEHHHRDRVAAEEQGAPGYAGNAPVGNAPVGNAPGGNAPVGNAPVAGAGGTEGYAAPEAGGDTTVMDRGGSYGGHTGRRRRGGLLSMLSRR